MKRLILLSTIIIFTSTTFSVKTYSQDKYTMGIYYEKKPTIRHPKKKQSKRYLDSNTKKRKIKTDYKPAKSDCHFFMIYTSEMEKERNKALKKNKSRS